MCSWWNKEYPVYEVWGNVLGVEVVLVEEDRRDITSEYAHFTFSHTIWPLSLSSNFCTDIMTLAETASYKVRRWYWWVCCKRTGERGYSDISPLAATKTNAKYYYITNLQHLNSKFLFWRGTPRQNRTSAGRKFLRFRAPSLNSVWKSCVTTSFDDFPPAPLES